MSRRAVSVKISVNFASSSLGVIKYHLSLEHKTDIRDANESTMNAQQFITLFFPHFFLIEYNYVSDDSINIKLQFLLPFEIFKFRFD